MQDAGNAPVFDISLIEQTGLVRAGNARHAVNVHCEQILEFIVLTWRHVNKAILL